MGKYMRKAKVTSDIAVMELSQSSLGVKTRAKTLALQKLEAANSIQDSSCYLQLRNRRLEKTTGEVVKTQKSGVKESFKNNPDGNLKDLEGKSRRLNSGSVGSESGRRGKNEKGCETERNEQVGCFDLGVEASFGENNLEFDARERGTRESTPCSLIRGSDSIGNPGSSTKPRSLAASDRRTRDSMQQEIPATCEIEEFFAFAEQQQQKLFTEKYNFDVVNDIPLPGRYEWVRVYP